MRNFLKKVKIYKRKVLFSLIFFILFSYFEFLHFSIFKIFINVYLFMCYRRDN